MNSGKNIPETENGKSVNRRDSGFSLVETVVALLVLTVGLLGMATLAIYVMKGNKSSNQISTATALVQDKMEKLRGLGYENLPSYDLEDYGSIRINEDEDPPPEFYPYKRVVNVETQYLYSDGTVSGTFDSTKNIVTITKTAMVKVNWNPQYENRNFVEIQTLFSR